MRTKGGGSGEEAEQVVGLSSRGDRGQGRSTVCWLEMPSPASSQGPNIWCGGWHSTDEVETGGTPAPYCNVTSSINKYQPTRSFQQNYTLQKFWKIEERKVKCNILMFSLLCPPPFYY